MGDWAIVTGSSQGIGSYYAKELASRGLNVILIANDEVREGGREKLLEFHEIERSTCMFVLRYFYEFSICI